MKKKDSSNLYKKASRQLAKGSIDQSFTGVAATVTDLFARALAFHQTGRLAEAETCYRQALASNSADLNSLNNLGMLYLQSNRLPEGVQLIRESLEINPKQAAMHMNLGNALKALGKPDAALSSHDRAIALEPRMPQAYYNRANANCDLRRLDEALADYAHAITLKPDYVQAHFNLGNLQMELHRYEEARASYTRAIEIRPEFLEAYQNRGLALKNLCRLDDALKDCDQLLKRMPNRAETHYNRGSLLISLNRPVEALASYEQAIHYRPDYADAHYNRANLLREMNRLDEALASYDRAIACNPEFAEAHSNKGNVLHSLNRLDEALACQDRAISIKHEFAEAHKNRGNVLRSLKRYDEAIASYDAALAIDPELSYTAGSRLYCRLNDCDWDSIELDFGRINDEIARGKAVCEPFSFLSVPSDPQHQYQCARTYVLDRYPPRQMPICKTAAQPRPRIRLGYFSSDYHDHPVSHLLSHMIECHDRNHYEVFGFSSGPSLDDPWRRRLSASFDRFIDVSGKSDAEVVAHTRELGIDIAIDLNGHTKGARPGIFALRAAPIQVSYLGFACTSGADYFDYLIADRIVAPREHWPYYSEKIVHLPHSFMVNDSTKPISTRNFTRSELGLPDEGFVFCSFNNPYKITPDVFDIWMRLLNAVEGSVLWLSRIGATALGHLREQAVKHGIAAERIVIAQRMELLEDHLRRHCHADLFLDTFYYNAHTTASDALWSGLPIVTCMGKTFASRVTASLLTAMDMPELITHSHEEYESLALKLATQPDILRTIRRKLASSIRTQPLFDTQLFTRHIESAFRIMHERHHAGLPPDYLVIPESI